MAVIVIPIEGLFWGLNVALLGMHLALCLAPCIPRRAEVRRARYYRAFPTVSKNWEFKPQFQTKCYEHDRWFPENSPLTLPLSRHILKTVFRRQLLQWSFVFRDYLSLRQLQVPPRTLFTVLGWYPDKWALIWQIVPESERRRPITLISILSWNKERGGQLWKPTGLEAHLWLPACWKIILSAWPAEVVIICNHVPAFLLGHTNTIKTFP